MGVGTGGRVVEIGWDHEGPGQVVRPAAVGDGERWIRHGGGASGLAIGTTGRVEVTTLADAVLPADAHALGRLSMECGQRSQAANA